MTSTTFYYIWHYSPCRRHDIPVTPHKRRSRAVWGKHQQRSRAVWGKHKRRDCAVWGDHQPRSRAVIAALCILAVAALRGPALAQTVGRYDIVISEIMADPTPTIGLPAAEYVELHNRLPHPCTLSGWKLQTGNTLKELPALTLDSAGYVIVVAARNLAMFDSLGIPAVALSSLSITDGGQRLTLYNAQGEVIHSVTFKKTWHSESVKQDGGWSLEMLDERMPCLGATNWNSSTSPLGGSPGAPNAARRTVEDHDPPLLERLTLLDSSTLRLFFSEPLQPPLPLHTAWCSISPLLDITEVREVPPHFDALDIRLGEMPHFGVHYRIALSGDFCDCAGNHIVTGELPFGLTQSPTARDLVINEVLSHPFDGADADFIEIYNRSSKIIDLKEVKIGSGGDTLPGKAIVAVGSGRQLFPGEYCALCKDRDHTLSHYYCPNARTLQPCDSLPAYNNGSGIVHLTTVGLLPLDRFAYDEGMHYSGLMSTEGVSLERLRADEASQDEANWHSAASTAGFATPGYRNSHAGDELPRDELAITPEVFSPDNDGFEDFTEFTLRFTQPENRLSIQIFDRLGRLVRTIVNNEYCGTEALFRWDGTDTYGTPLPTGSYIAVLQWRTPDGRSKRVRRGVGVWRIKN